MAALNPHLQLLLAAQQGAHVGQGGRPQAMPDDERAALLDHAKHNKPQNLEAFTAAPEDEDAADSLASFVTKLLRRLIASHYYLIKRETDAMIWLGSQFKGNAGQQWTLVSELAEKEASKSGIGVQSVVYRALRDMLAVYPFPDAKAEWQVRKARDFVWNYAITANANRANWNRFFEF